MTPSDAISTWTMAMCPSPKMVCLLFPSIFKHNYDTKMIFPLQNVMLGSISLTKI